MKQNRRTFLASSITLLSSTPFYPFFKDASQNHTTTFIVGADLHLDKPPESEAFHHVRAINSVGAGAVWPKTIEKRETHFSNSGNKIAMPQAVLLAGDLLDKAHPKALDLFKQRYEIGQNSKQINYPVYLGLGNHDINPHVEEEEKQLRRKMMWNYIEERHAGKQAPVPVLNFDPKSRNYSWNIGEVHFIQTHLFAGATSDKQQSSTKWLKEDLKTYANNGQKVVLIQHYGFDDWSKKEWWTENEREELHQTIKAYNIVAIFTGHNHIAEIIKWKGIPIFQINNGWEEKGKGNNDGDASFALVQISSTHLDLVTCGVKDGEGNFEFKAPFYHQSIDVSK